MEIKKTKQNKTKQNKTEQRRTLLLGTQNDNERKGEEREIKSIKKLIKTC